MLRIASKVHYHSPDEVLKALRASVDLADEAELSPEDRAVLLPSIMANLLQAHIELEQVQLGVDRMAIPRGLN